MDTSVKSKDASNETKKKNKSKFRMPSALTIIIGVVFFVTILTWNTQAANKAYSPEGNGWADGSLAAWQNQILFDAMIGTPNKLVEYVLIDDYGNNFVFSIEYDPTGFTGVFDETTFFLNAKYDGESINDLEAINHLIDIYGLEGYFDVDLQLFITDYSVPWTISNYSDGSSSMFGLLDSFKAMMGGYFMAIDVALYIIGIYALVLLLMQTNTLRDGVSSLVKGLGDKEILLVPILFVLFSLGGTLFGMQEETIGLLPIIVPVLVLAGFDAPTGLLVAVVGTTSGIASSVLDPFSIGVMAAGLGTGIGTGILERLLLFFVITSVTCSLVTLYAARVKKNNDKSIDSASIEKNKEWAKESIGDINDLETMTRSQKAALSIFGITFLWMIISLMPWTTWFPTLNDSEGWKFLSAIFYGQVLLGEWYFIELSIMFLAIILIVGKIFKYSNTKIFNVIKTSTIEMFGVITIIAFSRSISVILQSTGLTYGIIYSVIDPNTLSNVGVIPFTLLWLMILTLIAFFIPSTSGLAGITAPIIGGVITAASGGSEEHTKLLIVGILMIYPLAQGCVNMFSPTTGIVIVQSDISRVSYSKSLPILGGFAGITMGLGIITSLIILSAEATIQGVQIF